MKYLKILFQWLFLGFIFILLISLLRGFPPGQANSKLPSEPLTSATPNPYPPPGSTPIPTTTPFTYPFCQFQSQVPPEANPISNLDQFKFSDPQIIQSNEGSFGILNWTPDSENLIFARQHLRDGFYTVELLNLKDKTSFLVGDGFDFWGLNAYNGAVWVNAYQAIAFTQSKGQKKPLLRIRDLLQHDVISPIPADSTYFALDWSEKLLFFSDINPYQLQIFNPVEQTVSPAAVQLSPPSQYTSGSDWTKFRIAPRSSDSHWVIYNNSGAYIIDEQQKQVCEINWGLRNNEKLWAFQIQWSPDGRFLAAIVSVGQPVVPFIDLIVIDSWTGKYFPLDIGGKPIYAMSWSPNSRNFVVMTGKSRNETNINKYEEMYLVDVFTGAHERILVGYPFVEGTAHSGIVWSPNGKTIAADCQTIVPGNLEAQGRLCLIEVEIAK